MLVVELFYWKKLKLYNKVVIHGIMWVFCFVLFLFFVLFCFVVFLPILGTLSQCPV